MAAKSTTEFCSTACEVANISEHFDSQESGSMEGGGSQNIELALEGIGIE
jgi:hypothetical protein